MKEQMISVLFEVCLIPILGVLTSYLVTFIKAKINDLKTKTDNETTQRYLDLVGRVVTDCVQATNQTYVESLKATGSFDAEAQKMALQSTLDSVTSILSEEVKENLGTIVGDLNSYLIGKIEAEIVKEKRA